MKKVKYVLGSTNCITRDGKKVVIAGVNKLALELYQVSGWINGVAASWSAEGKYTRGIDHDFDLFALEPYKDGYINIHEDGLGRWADEHIYDFLKVAEENGKLSPSYSQTIKVEL